MLRNSTEHSDIRTVGIDRLPATHSGIEGGFGSEREKRHPLLLRQFAGCQGKAAALSCLPIYAPHGAACTDLLQKHGVMLPARVLLKKHGVMRSACVLLKKHGVM